MDQKYYLFDKVFVRTKVAAGVEIAFAGAIPRENGEYDIQFVLFYQAGYSGGGSTATYRARPGDALRLGHGMQIGYSKKGNDKISGFVEGKSCTIRSIERDCLELSF